MEWDEDMPHPGTAYLKVKSVPKGYSAIVDSNGNIDIYYDSNNKFYGVLVFPFRDGLGIRASI